MTSPMSADGHSRDNYSDHKPVRLQSLDERVSSLEAESRQHTDISGKHHNFEKKSNFDKIPTSKIRLILTKFQFCQKKQFGQNSNFDKKNNLDKIPPSKSDLRNF